MAVVTQIQLRRGTAAQWTSTNPTLAAGEQGYETDTGKLKIGDGSTAWNSLGYIGDGNVTLTGTQTLTNKTLTAPIITIATTSDSGSGYTLVLTDQSKVIEMSNGSGNTLTIPTNSSVAFPIGTTITVLQVGSGQTTIAGAGVTINGTPGLKLRAQWSSATLIKRATNTWVAIGDLSA
jgi:hypothetical protein